MKLGRWIGLIMLLAALYLLWRVRQVLLLIFTAIVIGVPFNRLVQRWQAQGIQRSLARILAIVTLIMLLFLFGITIVPPFIDQFQRLGTFVVLGLEQLQNWLIRLQERLPDPLISSDSGSLIQRSQPWISWVVDHFFTLFSDVLTLLLNLLLILVLTLMVLANPAGYRQGVIRLFPAFYRQRIDAVLSECEDKLAIWMQVTFWQMVIVGGLSAISLWVLQVPLVLTNAVFAGLLEVIPNLGVLLSLIPPFAAAWFLSPKKAMAVIVLYLLTQGVKHYCLKRIGLHRPDAVLPAIMLLAQLSLAFFCGFSGLLLAVPIITVVQVCMHEILLKDILAPAWEVGRAVTMPRSRK